MLPSPFLLVCASPATTLAQVTFCCVSPVSFISGLSNRRYIVNDIPIVWARWPTHDSIIIVRGRALIVVVVVLLFEGGIVDVVDELQLLLAVVDLNQRVD